MQIPYRAPLVSESPAADAPAHTHPAVLPLGALLLAAGCQAWAQSPAPVPGAEPTRSLKAVTVTESADTPQGKDSLRATTTTVGKGNQALRDVPQSITVVTEKLMDERNLDTLKDALRNTAGITFQAAEGGEEDIRLRGYSLATTGDIYLNGLRDPAFYDRDTFWLDRVEVLRGSASMLFGRGSTGGVVNQVSKTPQLIDEHQVDLTLGSHTYRRVTGDFNWKLGDSSALRINLMANRANNNGAGSTIDKSGGALSWRTGVGERNEFQIDLLSLDNRNGINYGLPWIRPRASDSSASTTLIPGLAPTGYYGMGSDRNHGQASVAGLRHTHRFSREVELVTQVRLGDYNRDLRASAIRFAPTTGAVTNPQAVDIANLSANTVLTRGTNLKIQQVQTAQVQSDFSAKFSAWGFKHEVLTGIDLARERKNVQTPFTAAQGGVVPVKPPTNLGAASDSGVGPSIDEGLRNLRDASRFENTAVGVYAQDLVHITPTIKLLGGVRYDQMRGNYTQFNLPANAAQPIAQVSYSQTISDWSQRLGALWQPTDRHSLHFAWGTSFNTSGDTYSYNALSANTPPEQSRNIELGGRIESANKRVSTRFAVFRTTKLNERNTDPDTAATRLLLSGQRHSAGVELDVAGRITPLWEVYASYVWMPIARVDRAASTATTVGNRVGDRPGLSPRHSGTVWSTYQLSSHWRLGGGINFRARQSPADVTAPAWEAPGFATADALLEYTVNAATSLRLNISNLTDKYYADALYRGHYVPGAGRLVQLTLSSRF